MKYKRFLNNTFMQYIMTFAQYLFPLITFPYLTRVLEPEMYGIVTYLTATITFFQIFVDYGFNLSATKEIAQNQDNKKFIGKIVGSIIQAKVLLVLASILIYTIIIMFIPILQENIILSYLYMGTVVLSIWLPDFLFRGIERMAIITNRFLVSKTITTALTFVMVQSKDDVIWIPLLNIFGSLVAILLTWYQIKKTLRIRVYFSSFRFMVSNIKISTVYFISTFATTAFGIANTFMLGVMELPLNQVAYWSLSYSLIGMAQSLYTPITNSLYPHMVARRDFKLVKKLLIIFMPLILLTTIFVWGLSDLIITILAGKQYLDAVPIFRSLLPVLIFSFPAMVLGFPVLGAIGKVKETTITTIISSLFHIMGLVVLVVSGKFTVINIAILRSITEFILLATRGYYILRMIFRVK
ncbi:oligosaccharide flippase family protein [Lysinibacillus xylanilyticus]|uniref:oligosaccharide flippase family protein n=1 Tax=Lysinibacillus xylanilyticus TaxID=582475 RepID=UPI00382638AC